MNAQPTDAVAQKALESLADIATPAPVPWMPQTWGWTALAVVVLAALVVSLWRWRRRALANRYRTEALAILARLEPQAIDPRTRVAALTQIAELIKRTALAAFPRDTVADLSGPSWAAFIGSHDEHVTASTLALFDDLEYRPGEALAGLSDSDAKALVSAARGWIRGHRVPA